MRVVSNVSNKYFQTIEQLLLGVGSESVSQQTEQTLGHNLTQISAILKSCLKDGGDLGLSSFQQFKFFDWNKVRITSENANLSITKASKPARSSPKHHTKVTEKRTPSPSGVRDRARTLNNLSTSIVSVSAKPMTTRPENPYKEQSKASDKSSERTSPVIKNILFIEDPPRIEEVAEEKHLESCSTKKSFSRKSSVSKVEGLESSRSLETLLTRLQGRNNLTEDHYKGIINIVKMVDLV